MNGKICEILETLDNGRMKVKIDKLIISVKPECLLQKKNEFSFCGGCKIIMYCNLICQKRHWKEGRHKEECKAYNSKTVVVIKNRYCSVH